MDIRTSGRRGRVATRENRGIWSLIGLTTTLLILGGCGAATSSTGGGGNAITVTTDKASYTSTDTIVVTITNGLTTTVLAADHQSNCSIVSVERYVAQAWQRQAPCLLMSPTRLIEIHAGDSSVQRLQPPAGAGASGWPRGSYRVVFAYQLTPTGSSTTLPPVTFSVS